MAWAAEGASASYFCCAVQLGSRCMAARGAGVRTAGCGGREACRACASLAGCRACGSRRAAPSWSRAGRSPPSALGEGRSHHVHAHHHPGRCPCVLVHAVVLEPCPAGRRWRRGRWCRRWRWCRRRRWRCRRRWGRWRPGWGRSGRGRARGPQYGSGHGGCGRRGRWRWGGSSRHGGLGRWRGGLAGDDGLLLARSRWRHNGRGAGRHGRWGTGRCGRARWALVWRCSAVRRGDGADPRRHRG
jgi:hypothetical protein